MINLKETFEKHTDEFLKFDRVENKLHPRPDLCAFLLLDKLLPNDGRDMVCAASHDEIFLDAEYEKLSEVATEDDVITLLRCGVLYDEDSGGLSMFA